MKLQVISITLDKFQYYILVKIMDMLLPKSKNGYVIAQARNFLNDQCLTCQTQTEVY